MGGGRPFVGREREAAAVRDALERVLEGRGGLLLVSGEPGIGKTRLAERAEELGAARGAATVWSRCWDSGGAPPFWPWIQVTRALLRNDPSLAEAAGPALGVLALDAAPRSEEDALADPEGGRFALFEAAAALLRAAGERGPLVVVLDDLHAADAPSLLLLRFAAANLRDAPVLLVGTARDVDADPEPEAADVLGELAKEADLLHLGGLGEDDVMAFIAEAAGVAVAPAVAAAVHDATGGNPFFLGEVVREELAGGEQGFSRPLRAPRAVRQAIVRRARRLRPEVRELLQTAAVVGREASLPRLRAVTGWGTDELLGRLSDAVQAGLLVPDPVDPARHAFRHALIREALYDDLPVTRRVAVHLRVAETLERLPDADGHLDELAHHFLRAAPLAGPERGAAYARRAGERAMRVYAYEEAAAHFARALAAMDGAPGIDAANRLHVLLGLGRARLAAGQAGLARETFSKAADLASATGDAGLLAEAALAFGQTGEFGMLDRPKVRLLERALWALGDAGDPALRARLLARLAMETIMDPASAGRRDERSAEAVRLARPLGDAELQAFTLNARLQAVWGPGTLEERLRTAEELMAVAEASGDLERILEGHQWRLYSLLEMGDIVAADAEIDAYARVAEELHRPQFLAWAALRRSMRAFLAGRFEEGIAWARRRHALGLEAEDPGAESDLAMQVTFGLSELGRHDELAELVPVLAEAADRLSFLAYARVRLMAALSVLGREAEARAELERLAADDFGAILDDFLWPASVAELAVVLERSGDRDRAGSLYRRALPYAGMNVMASTGICYGSAERYLGLLALAADLPDEAVGHLERALERNRRMGAAPWVGHAARDLAKALLRRRFPGDEARAAELLDQAARIAADLGMRTLAARVEELRSTAAGPEADGSVAVFRREGEYWAVGRLAAPARLRASKGLEYLARLLAAPEVEFHVLDLAASGVGLVAPVPAEGLDVDTGDAGEVLDDRAKAAYRRRAEELRDELEEARSWNDPERAARAREELEVIADQLAGAVGLGGRDRRAASTAERARVAVTRAIRSAIDRIGRADPDLGRHLDNAVKTGTFCRYAPDPRSRVDWEL